MKFGSAIIGLAIGERQAVVAQAQSTREQRVVTRAATFAYPPELSLDKPAELGALLAAFLKSNGFDASRAIVGLPAKWLLAREKQVPPVGRSEAEAILRMQAERQLSSESGSFIFDYAGTPDSSKQTNVLLLAAGKQYVDNAAAMATAAGLKVAAVTSSTLALGAMMQSDRHGMILLLGNEAAELAVFNEGAPRALRHLPVSGLQLASSNGTAAGALSALSGEIMRTAATGGADTLTIWDGIGMNDAAHLSLENRAGLTVAKTRDLSRMGVTIEAPESNDAKYGAAAALALVAADTSMLPVDFLHSRLAPPKQNRFGSTAIWGTFAAIVLVAVGGWMLWDMHQRQAEVDKVEKWLDEQSASIKTAEARVARTELARGWFDTRTPVLDCMKNITQSFPTDGSVIATSFSLRENGKGLLAGRSPDQKSGLAIRDRLMGDKRFVDVTLIDMRDAGGNSRDVVFTIAFTYVGGK